MPLPYDKQFRADVIAVARRDDVSIAQVAKDFRISEACLRRWLKVDDMSLDPAGSVNLQAELKAARRRITLLEQENEVFRRAAAYLAMDTLPKKDCTR